MALTKPFVATEEAEQIMLAQWLDSRPGLLWCHVPNGGLRNIKVAAKLMRCGVKAGVPDILIFTRPPKAHRFVGTALELKRDARNASATGEQKYWLRSLEEMGWCARVARGAKEAIDWLMSLGY